MVLGLSGSFVRLAIATSLTRLIIYFICSAALPVIKGKADRTTIARAYKLKGGYTIPLIAGGLCLWMMSHTSADSWKLTGILLVVGLAFYWLEQQRIKRQNAA